MDILKEIELHEKLVDEYTKTLDMHADACAKHPELHILPAMEQQKDGSTQIVVNIVNIKDGTAKVLKIEGGPARFFYDAYRELAPQIFALAKEKADASIEARAAELRTQIADEEKRLAEAKKALSKHGKAKTVKTA